MVDFRVLTVVLINTISKIKRLGIVNCLYKESKKVVDIL
jgi:hypothetical protein